MARDTLPEKAVTEAVVDATGRHEGCSSPRLPPFAETIGTKGLDSTFETMTERTPDVDPNEFRFEGTGYTVTVYETGTIEVEPMTDRVIVER